jgi:EmrB/QacA subfamily drug resistance transporter
VPSEPSPPAWRGLALLVAGAFFMENLDGTIISTAAPRMAQSFGVPSVELNVTITAYLLTLGVFIPVSGWIADRYGAQTIFAAAIATFTVASGLCATSTGLAELTGVRVLQGIGGAMMVPVGRLVVLRRTDKADLINAIAYLTWPALAAPVIAPALGGVLTTYASWRWIFVINLPLGVAAFLVTLRIVPNVRDLGRAALDWWGFVLTGAGLATFVYGLEVVTDGKVAWVRFGVAVAAGAVLITLAVAHLQRSAHPLLDLRVFRIPTFRVTNAGGTFFRMAIGAAPFLLPLMFQDGFGWSPVKSGLVVIAVFVGNIGIKPFTTPILRRFGFRTVLVGSGTAAAVTLALCATFTATSPLPLMIADLVASGVFRSIGFTAYNTIVFADVAPAEMSNANTLTSTIQQLTMGLGVAVGAVALQVGTHILGLSAAANAGRRPFAVAFLLIAALPLLAVIESARLERRAGAAIAAPQPAARART